MSEPPIAVRAVVQRDGEERISGQAVFDGREEALTAIDVLMRMWAWDGEGRRIEVEHV